MRRILLFAFSILAGTGVVLAAQQPAGNPPPDWYRVEVLVFRYTGANAAQGEIWPAKVAAPPLASARYPAAAATGAYAALARPSAMIAAASRRLSAAAGYAPVAEVGWQQPAGNHLQGQAVSLSPLPATTAKQTPAAVPATTPAAFSETLPEASPTKAAPPASAGLTGTATLVVANNKPHIILDLRLCEPSPPGIQIQIPTVATATVAATAPAASSAAVPAGPSASQLPVPGSLAPPAAAPRRQCFLLNQRRQVTAGRLEYFDNPAFGALVLVSPVKPPAAKAAGPQAKHALGQSPSPDLP